MTRRIIQSIRNSFFVYLPKEWCERFHITKGMEISITDTDEGQLIVYPPELTARGPREIIIQIDEQEWSSTPTLLVGAYVTGFTRTEFRTKKKFPLEWRERLNTLSRKLLGFEVTEETDQSLVLEDVMTSYELLPILRREFTALKYMLDGTLSCLGSLNPAEAFVVINRDDDVDRYRYAVERLSHLAIREPTIRVKVKVSTDACLNYSMAAKYLERMADHASAIAKEITKGRRITSEAQLIMQEIIQHFETVTRLFFAKGEAASHPILEPIYKSLARLENMERSTEQDFTRIYNHHFGRLLSYCADLAEVAIDLAFGESRKNLISLA